MAVRDIDSYLAGVAESKRNTLQQLRRSVLEVVPDAEECISYGMSAFKVHFPIDQPLPPALMTKLVKARLRELGF